MEIKELAAKQELTELANKLFMYTDAQQWQLLQQEVFDKNVWFDMSSAGAGEAKSLTAAVICDMWKQGFEGLDAVHHQAGQYLVSVRNNEADIYAYAIASHYKKVATKGNTRLMVGSYDLTAKQMNDAWRITQFKYNLKYIDGNSTLE